MARRALAGVTAPAAALLAGALLAGCGGNAQSQLEREVQDYLRGLVAPAVISDISCPDDIPIRAGEQFLCDGLVEESFYEAQVTIIDQNGRWEARPRQAVLLVSATETALGAEAAAKVGFSIQADCGDSQFLVVSVGGSFVCRLHRVDTAQTQNIVVEVRNEVGALDWTFAN